MTNSIVNKIKANRSNPNVLLDMASSDTLDLVAAHFNVSPQYAAPKTAQVLFGAQKIAIKSKGQPGSRYITRVYDLTDPSAACEALQDWGVGTRSRVEWVLSGYDAEAYLERALANPSKISRHVTTSIQVSKRNA